MASVTPDLQLLSQLQSTAAGPWPVLISRSHWEQEAELAQVAGFVPRRHIRERTSILVLTGLDVK